MKKFEDNEKSTDENTTSEDQEGANTDTLNEQEKMELLNLLGPPPGQPELRLTGIYGDVTETRCSEAIFGLIALSPTPAQLATEGFEPEPIDFVISTHGGHAAEMFSVYDIIRDIKQRAPVHTKGVGKVMSAGVLLLASGTKGQRRIGKYCRVMIHGVIAGQSGYIGDMEHEFKETKYIQKMYIKALAEETNMTPNYIKRLMGRKTNVYLDAEEAVKLGIADIIF